MKMRIKPLLKTFLYLLTFIGVVGYLETGNLIFTIAIAIGTVGIININFKK